MDKGLQVFSFEKRDVRVVMKGGEPWWVAKDVCDILGLSNAREAIKALDDDEKSTVRISDGAGGPERNVINESGVYALIMRSNKPEARRFRKWVTLEVLPSIRKHGIYTTEEMARRFIKDPRALEYTIREHGSGEDEVLHIIGHEVVPVYQDNQGCAFVDARELHTFLESGRHFADWIKDRIAQYGFSDGEDYTSFHKSVKRENSTGATIRTEYLLTVGMAKELAMIENNDKGRLVRKYFIKCEGELMRILAQAKAKAEIRVNILETKAAEDAHKVSFYDAVADVDDFISIANAAKLLGYKNMGPQKLFAFLRKRGVLMSSKDRHNVPYQQYIDKGFFRFSECSYTDWRGETYVHYRPFVSQKGLSFINQLLLKSGCVSLKGE